MTKQERRVQQANAKRTIVQDFAMATLSDTMLIEFLGDSDHCAVAAAWDTLFERGPASIDSLLQGMEHSDHKIRARCALLLDHLGDERCSEPLHRLMRSDRRESVRRNAMHSLACQPCKERPLPYDVVGALLEAAQHDRSLAVRRRAVQYLIGQSTDERVVAAMQAILDVENDSALRVRAERALLRHQTSDSDAASCPMCG